MKHVSFVQGVMTMMSRRRFRCLSMLLLLGMFSGAAAVQARADDCTALADVQAGDACATVVSVSVTGDAHSECTPPGTANSGCIAISGTGNASNNVASTDGCGSFVGGALGCVAVSGTGNASNTAGGNCAFAGVGVFVGCIAISGTGDASNEVNGTCGAGTIGLGVGCVAVSGTGNASNTVNPRGTSSYCGLGSLGIGLGCLAISGTGDASNTVNSSPTAAGACGYGVLGAGVGCAAISGAGAASNSADNCGTGDTGAGAGCVAGPNAVSAFARFGLRTARGLFWGTGSGFWFMARMFRF